VELGGRKQRTALASLLVRAGRVVSLDQIVDDLWPEHPPTRAAATVQVFVSNLRRALEPDRPRGAPERSWSRRRAATSWPSNPAASTRRSSPGWPGRGAPRSTGTIPSRPPRSCAARWSCGRARRSRTFAPFARAEAARLDELRLGAVEDRIDADLALGRHSALVAELELQCCGTRCGNGCGPS
jgi:hypothetical protein